MNFKSRITEVGVPNKNGHVYQLEVIQTMLDRSNKPEQFGELGMGVGSTIDLNRVSHQIKNLYIEDGWLMAKIHVLKTPMGNVLSEILTLSPVDFRMRGYGTIAEDGTVTDFELISIDAVRDGA